MTNEDVHGDGDRKRKLESALSEMTVPSSLEIERSIRICYYITGHGFGHAVRTVEISRHLLLKGHRITVCSTVPPVLLQRELPAVKIRHCSLDTGDPLASLQIYYEQIHRQKKDIIEREAKYLRDERIDVVLTDISSLACAIAKEAGIKSICISNFTWDFIYAEFLDLLRAVVEKNSSRKSKEGDDEGKSGDDETGRALELAEGMLPKFEEMVNEITKEYEMANLAIVLGGSTPLPTFDWAMEAPLVVRKSKRDREEVRKEYGCTAEDKLALLQFGGHPQDMWDLKSCFLPKGWKCLVVGVGISVQIEEDKDGKFIEVPIDSYVPDLVNAVDVVIGKIGYGSVSEVVAHKVPFVYVPRGGWGEERYLIAYMESTKTPSFALDRNDFFEGEWKSVLESAFEAKKTNEFAEVDCDGGSKAASVVEIVTLQWIEQREN